MTPGPQNTKEVRESLQFLLDCFTRAKADPTGATPVSATHMLNRCPWLGRLNGAASGPTITIPAGKIVIDPPKEPHDA